MMLVTTVAGKKANYSNLDVRRATAARRLQEIIGYPSTAAYLKMIDNNAIKNCPVTRRDITMANDIFGANPNEVKGKMVWVQPGHVREDITPVPPDILDRYGEVALSIDVYYLNDCAFLRTISRHLMFRSTIAIGNMRKKTLLKKIQSIAKQYALRGFVVTQIHGDNQFTCLTDELAEQPLSAVFHPVGANCHEPFIERDNRTSKERCRCIVAGLPFKRMTKRMIMELPPAADFWLNNWCSSGGVSDTIPPRQLITGMQLDANIHCKFQFGDYILAFTKSDNSMNVRAIDGIYLRPTGSPDGAFWVLNLNTGERVRRLSARAAHMTDTIIKRVEELATLEGMPIGITMKDRNQVTVDRITINDLDTESIASIDEDDNASDDSYAPDDESIETRLSDHLENEIDPTINTDNNQTDPQPIEEWTEADGNIDHEEADDLSTAEIGVTDDEEQDDTHNNANDSDVGANDDGNEANDENVETEEVSANHDNEAESNNAAQRSLRESVNRINAKTFEQETHHRNAFFTAGYAAGMKQLERNHEVYCFVQKTVEIYNDLDASLVTPQYGIERGLKIFKELGAEAVMKELRQLHNMDVITPMHIKELSEENIRNALPYLMFLKRKRCGKVKGRGCADGRAQREFISREESSSPTASLYAIILTSLVDAIEDRYVVTADIPGAFLQTDMPTDEDPIYIKFTGSMVTLLEKIDPQLYSKCIHTTRKGRKILYAKANKAIYGTLKAALLFWKKLKGTLASWGFVENKYDACTMNKLVDGTQLTVVWHVDDLKISHLKQSAVDELLTELDLEFGGESGLTTNTGKIHDYLGMTIDYSMPGNVMITMYDYLQDIIATLPEGLQSNRTFATPAGDHLFTIDDSGEKLNAKDSETFHKYVAKLLFAAKRARPDIQTAIAFLCTRVKSPDTDDWKKLIRVLSYVRDTIFLPLTIGWDTTGNIYWYVDASFAVHNDMKSHTGAVITFGKGGALSMSTKQKINTKSSTEAELVGVDDSLPFNIWCKYFLQQQGYHANSYDGKGPEPDYLGHKNILYQDNTSSIRLEMNGKASSTKRTRHINIRYFMITDRVKRNEISTIKHCPTEEMLADLLTKPLQGSLFKKFRNAIMGCSDADYIKHKIAFEQSRGRDNG